MFLIFGLLIGIIYPLILSPDLNPLFPTLLITLGSKMYCCLDLLFFSLNVYDLRIGHYLLPPPHMEESICDLLYNLFDCPSLSIEGRNFFISLNSLNVLFNFSFILNFKSEQVVNIVISFIQEAGFVIWMSLVYITFYYYYCNFLYWIVNILIKSWNNLIIY